MALGQDKHIIDYTIKQLNNTINQVNRKTLFSLGFVETILSLGLGFLRAVFQVNHWATTDNFTRTTKRQNTYKRKLTIILT